MGMARTCKWLALAAQKYATCSYYKTTNAHLCLVNGDSIETLGNRIINLPEVAEIIREYALLLN